MSTSGSSRFSFFTESLEPIIESMLFASTSPLNKFQIKKFLKYHHENLEDSQIENALNNVLSNWKKNNRSLGKGFEIANVAGGYVFRTCSKYSQYVKTFVSKKPKKLTRSQLEVLSIIAYRQPITRLEIEKIRGVDCCTALRKIIELKFITVLGRSKSLGRPWLYGTDVYFLEFLGLNSLADLPPLPEDDEIINKNLLDKYENGDDDVTSKILELLNENKKGTVVLDETNKLNQDAAIDLNTALDKMSNTTKKVNIDHILHKNINNII